MASRQEEEQTGIGAPSYIAVVIIIGIIVIGGTLLVANFIPQIFDLILPVAGSAEAQQVDNLFAILLIIGAAIFLLVEGLLVFSIIRFRGRSDDLSDGAPIHGNTLLEIVWTVIPAIIVAFLAFASYEVWIHHQTPKPDENLVNGEQIGLRAIGQRFAWSFIYETPVLNTATEDDPEDTVALTSNEFHTYVGQNVTIQLESPDVIHSFWVPAMRVKQDLLPGRTTEIRFTPIEAGRFRLVCAELCGGGHGEMYSWIVVHENEEAYLANFYDTAVAAVLNPPEDPILLGEQILSGAEYPCASCHVLTSVGWQGLTGPSLDGIGERAARRVSGLTAEEYITEAIRQPNAYIVPGYSAGLMPRFGPTEENTTGVVPYDYMPDEELIAIVSYLCAQVEAEGNESACDFENIPATVDNYSQ